MAFMTSLVLTFVGDDRPGLVNAISEKVLEFGGTWLESRSVRLAGKFAGVVLVQVPDDNLIPLESAPWRNLRLSGLRVSIERGAAPRNPKTRSASSHWRSSARSGRASCAT